MLSTDKQTDKLTNATKNITSFAKEVKKRVVEIHMQHYIILIICSQLYKNKKNMESGLLGFNIFYWSIQKDQAYLSFIIQS